MCTLEWYLTGVGTMFAVYFGFWLFGFSVVRRDLAMIPFFSTFGPMAFAAATAYRLLTMADETKIVIRGFRTPKNEE